MTLPWVMKALFQPSDICIQSGLILHGSLSVVVVELRCDGQIIVFVFMFPLVVSAK